MLSGTAEHAVSSRPFVRQQNLSEVKCFWQPCNCRESKALLCMHFIRKLPSLIQLFCFKICKQSQRVKMYFCFCLCWAFFSQAVKNLLLKVVYTPISKFILMNIALTDINTTIWRKNMSVKQATRAAPGKRLVMRDQRSHLSLVKGLHVVISTAKIICFPCVTLILLHLGFIFLRSMKDEWKFYMFVEPWPVDAV